MQRYKVSGMTCGRCVHTVTRAVEGLPGVERALVNLEAGEMSVDGDADDSAIRRAVEDAGYDVRERLL